MRKIFTLLLYLLFIPIVAQAEVWDGSVDTDWYTNDPEADGAYHISTAAELAGLAKLVNEGNTFDGTTIKLTQDITLNENVLTESGELNGDGSNFKQWTAIGNDDYPFQGTFDGQNHTISGIYIDNNSDYQGLFGCVDGEGATIQNLSVADSYIKAKDYVGGIVGDNYGTVSNCSNSGTVTGTNSSAYVGGIVGQNYGDSEVSNCSNSGTVTGTDSYAYVGGIVEQNGFGTVSNCSNSGTVTGGDRAYVGGIVGQNGFGTVSNCTNNGTVTGTGDDADVGGIVGSNFSDSEVSNCYYLDSSCDKGVGYNDEGTVPKEEDMEKSADKYTNGEVAYLLQKGQTEQVWGQRIGTDGYPVLLSLLSEEKNKADYKVYAATFTYKESPDAEKETAITKYGNSGDNINAPEVEAEGYIFEWNETVPAQFGTEDLEFTGTFTLGTYTLTLTPTDGGTITAKVDGEPVTDKVEYGATVTLEAMPSDSYHFNQWEVMPNTVTISEQNTFTMPASEVTVKAIFAEHEYTNWESNNDGTHTGTCSCGATKTEECTYGDDDKCTACGADKPSIADDAFEITGDAATIELGSSGAILTAVITGIDEANNAEYWDWESSNPEIATVEMFEPSETVTPSTRAGGEGTGSNESKALVTPVSEGEAKITVTYNSPKYKGTKSYTITVKTKEEPTDPEEPEDPETPVIPDMPEYYNIMVDECEGVTVETSSTVVREGQSMTFTVDVAEGYTSEDMTVKVKRSLFGYTEVIEPNDEGIYEIKNIYTDIYITVDGVEEEEEETPTGMEDVESAKVYTKDGSIYVQTPKQEQVQIISISGSVLKNETQIGLQRYDLPRGIYIIGIGEERYKVRN